MKHDLNPNSTHWRFKGEEVKIRPIQRLSMSLIREWNFPHSPLFANQMSVYAHNLEIKNKKGASMISYEMFKELRENPTMLGTEVLPDLVRTLNGAIVLLKLSYDDCNHREVFDKIQQVLNIVGVKK